MITKLVSEFQQLQRKQETGTSMVTAGATFKNATMHNLMWRST